MLGWTGKRRSFVRSDTKHWKIRRTNLFHVVTHTMFIASTNLLSVEAYRNLMFLALNASWCHRFWFQNLAGLEPKLVQAPNLSSKLVKTLLLLSLIRIAHLCHCQTALSTQCQRQCQRKIKPVQVRIHKNNLLKSNLRHENYKEKIVKRNLQMKTFKREFINVAL